jgi:translation initiation factor 3 subunit L
MMLQTGQLRKLPGSEQFNKLYDRMLALLAILTHVCPPSGLVEDGVARAVREKYGGQLSKIEAGEEGYEDLFIFACPKFIHPAVPDYSQASAPGAAATVSGPQDSYKLQVQHFMTEMSAQQTMRKLRSYMKLYTSISVGKLAAFNDMTEAEFLPLLVSYKHKMRQMERTTNTEGDDSLAAATDGPLGGKLGTALDIHYYIVNEMVHVDEAEKQRRFEDYFMAQISQMSEITKHVEAISTVI